MSKKIATEDFLQIQHKEILNMKAQLRDMLWYPFSKHGRLCLLSLYTLATLPARDGVLPFPGMPVLFCFYCFKNIKDLKQNSKQFLKSE